MMDSYLSLNSMENILREAGADRVSRAAKEALRDHLQEHATSIGELALTYTEHAGRKTVKAEDIESALTVDE